MKQFLPSTCTVNVRDLKRLCDDAARVVEKNALNASESALLREAIASSTATLERAATGGNGRLE